MISTDRHPCPCCRYLVYLEQPNGDYDICPICYWEDDPVQVKDPSRRGGANRVSLDEARKNFAEFKACRHEDIGKTREPLPEEIP